MIHFVRKAKLTHEIVAQLRREFPNETKVNGEWCREMGKRYGVHEKTISRAVNGTYWALPVKVVGGEVV